MKAERINQDQIRFTIDEGDLIARNIRVSELAYGSKKTQALFDDMMKEAMEMFGIDFSEKPLMIEAIPLSDDKLSVTVTKVEGMAELGAMIGANLPGNNQSGTPGGNAGSTPFAGSPLDSAISAAKNGAKAGKKEAPAGKQAGGVDNRKTEAPSITMQIGTMASAEPVVYFFRSMEKLLQVAADVPEKFPLKNSLYRDMGDGCYYLICEYKNVGSKTRHLIAMLSQYTDEWYAGQHVTLMAREHGIKVLQSRALQKLGAVQRSDK